MDSEVLLLIRTGPSPLKASYICVNLRSRYPQRLTKLDDVWVFGHDKHKFSPDKGPAISILSGAGHSHIEIDGIPATMESDNDMISRFGQNLTTVYPQKALKDDLPVYIAQGRELNPVEFLITVHLDVKVLGDLPDVEAHIALWDIGTRSMRKRIDRMAKAGHCEANILISADELRRVSKNAMLSVGLYLPVFAVTEKSEVDGVLYLQSLLPGGSFACKLFLTDVAHINAGTVLVRRVQWSDNDKNESRTVQIARILAVS